MSIQDKTIEEIRWKYATIKVYYLKMDSPKGNPLKIKPDLKLKKLEMPYSAEAYLEMYRAVGDAWNWMDRLMLPPEELESIINRPGTEIYAFHNRNHFVGYGELVLKSGAVEIQYFGLIPEAIGKGMGHYFLASLLNRAWDLRTELVQLNTCEMDHPGALKFYESAGFRHFETRHEERKVLMEEPLIP